MQVIHEFKPIYDENAKILILGSIPSIKSREIGFYYAHPQNRFWPIMENLFNTRLNTKEEKINFLINEHIALWDTFKSVEITGSSDSSIKNSEINDINMILAKCSINAIFCTGKASYNGLTKVFKTNIPIIYLPSPSSANATLTLAKLINEYSVILNYLKK